MLPRSKQIFLQTCTRCAISHTCMTGWQHTHTHMTSSIPGQPLEWLQVTDVAESALQPGGASASLGPRVDTKTQKPALPKLEELNTTSSPQQRHTQMPESHSNPHLITLCDTHVRPHKRKTPKKRLPCAKTRRKHSSNGWHTGTSTTLLLAGTHRLEKDHSQLPSDAPAVRRPCRPV